MTTADMTPEEKEESLQARIERLEGANARLKRANEELTDELCKLINSSPEPSQCPST